MTFPNDKEWQAALTDQMCYHYPYLKDIAFQKRIKLHYAKDFANFIDSSLAQCPK
ncbi:MAG: hypothetical protein DID89_2727546913 [Candidatus Nitrotoga sp. CP45]|nr:MAG: hypothetical protein DID89_2727546913 [Candidatus Nitrotoga sp. CP45]